jgi:tetratricopeptide (TPR) repeat protein
LQDLANRFYTRGKKATNEAEKGLSSHLSLAALAIYEKLRDISLKDAAYNNYLEPIELRMADICMEENRIDRAAELYTAALGRNPQSADAVYGLGLIYERQGKWREALRTWRKFSDGVEAGTYHWFQSRYRTAVALHKLGETERACTVTTMTRVLHPDFGDNELERKYLELESKLCKGETAQ